MILTALMMMMMMMPATPGNQSSARLLAQWLILFDAILSERKVLITFPAMPDMLD